MTKNIFLATAAVGVMAFAGAASAHTISYRAAAAPTTDIDGGDVNLLSTGDPTTTDLAVYGQSLVGLYLIADEALGSGLSQGTLALTDALSSGNLPSGNNLYTISLSNGAQFGAAVTSAAVSGTGCTAALSSGGGATESTVTFLVSTSGAACNTFTLNVPVKPTAAGGVTVTTNLRTEANNPIDGGVATFQAIYAIDAFQPKFSAAVTGVATTGAAFDTTTPIGSGATPYVTLAGDGNLGRAAIYVDTRAHDDLDPSQFVGTGDVTAASLAVAGDFDSFNATLANATFDGVSATSITTTLATFTGIQANIVELLTNRPVTTNAFVVTADGAQIDTSDYTATINYTLTTGDFATQPAAGTSKNFETIEREGTNFIAPWAGGSQGGSQTVIRLSSTGGASGGVFVTLTNAYTTGNVARADASCQLPTGVPADGDLVIGQPQLTTCFGAFLRGDLIITVEASPAQITAKMRNSSSNGTFETTLGRYSGSTIAGASIVSP